MTSRFALIAAAGILLCGAMTPAKAADIGAGCCADLEERVAELEATTARKGNRVVSLQVYGQVNKALLIWDDGIDSDAFVVDNTRASSRVGLIGKADIKPGWTAGYNMEFEVLGARGDEVTNGYYNNPKDGDEGYRSGLGLRQNYWYVDSDRFGRLSIGQQNTASSGTSEVVLANSMRSADVETGSAMCIQTKGLALNDKCNGTGGYLNSTALQHQNAMPAYMLYALQWGEDFTANNIADVIRYDSPSIYGFILSASWGANDYSDVALRFKKEFADFRVAAAASYQWENRHTTSDLGWNVPNVNSTTLAGSVSIMHVPSGIYGAFAAGQREYQHNGTNLEDPSYWYVQGGIERKFLPYGTTTIFAEYGEYNSFQASYIDADTGDMAKNDSKATRIGFGVVQKIDAANMDIYAQATVWSFENNASKTGGYAMLGDGGTPYQFYDLSTILIGSRLKF